MPTEHHGRFDLLQSIFANERVDDPGFFEFDGTTDDPVEIEQCCLGTLFVNLQRAGLEMRESFEAAGGVQAFEAIDEYRLSFQLTDDDGRYLSVVLE